MIISHLNEEHLFSDSDSDNKSELELSPGWIFSGSNYHNYYDPNLILFRQHFLNHYFSNQQKQYQMKILGYIFKSRFIFLRKFI